MSTITESAATMAAVMAASSSSLADSPISRLFISMASTMAMTPSSRPMAVVPAPSQRPLPVSADMVDGEQGDHQADQRARVLEQHDGQLGLLRAADEAEPRRVALERP